jgi:hypothetical protein
MYVIDLPDKKKKFEKTIYPTRGSWETLVEHIAHFITIVKPSFSSEPYFLIYS